MERGRGDQDDFFSGNPFPNFGTFGGFGARRTMFRSLFGGRDPFDDPFFTRPFDGVFGHNMAGPTRPLDDAHSSSFLNQASRVNASKSLVIEELNSDDEVRAEEDNGTGGEKDTPNHCRSSQEPFVNHPDEEADAECKGEIAHYRSNSDKEERAQPRNQSFSFQSVKYGGLGGTYYCASTTRRTGSDGVVLEEKKEADSTTGQAQHKVSRGIHDKGHSVTRKLASDGKVDTMQTLHNLNEDELAGFEEYWKHNTDGRLPGWSSQSNLHENAGSSSSSSSRNTGQINRGVRLVSSPAKKVVRINIE